MAIRTVKRLSVELNQGKFDRLEREASAFAREKQEHLNFYQVAANFAQAWTDRQLRDALTASKYRSPTGLSVRVTNLAIKEAFETEAKYWAAMAAEIRPGVSGLNWTDAQKHYAYWLLASPQRFSALILGCAPINEQIALALAERKQVQNYLRRRARRIRGKRPEVKTARSFVIDPGLYTVGETLTGQHISIASLDRGERIRVPVEGQGEIKGNLRVVLLPQTRQIEIHVTFDLDRAAPLEGQISDDRIAALDAGLTEVFTDEEGHVYGEKMGEVLKTAARRTNAKGKKRNKLAALAAKYDKQGKKKKARNIRRENLGRRKLNATKRQTKAALECEINRAINELLKNRQPAIVIVEKLDLRGPAQSKELSRRVSYWHRSTLNERIEFKASAASCRRERVNPAYTSQTCPQCGYLDKANRKGEAFQCLNCGYAGQSDRIAAINQKARYADPEITLYTPKERVKAILLGRFKPRLEHRNEERSDETVTVPGRTSERSSGRTG